MRFHLRDVLCVTTGRMLSSDGMGGVYKILNFLTQDNLFTHQLPRANNEAAPWLLYRYPSLASVDVSFLDNLPEDVNERRIAIDAWIKALIAIHGEWFDLEPIPTEDHQRIDPYLELRTMVGSKPMY